MRITITASGAEGRPDRQRLVRDRLRIALSRFEGAFSRIHVTIVPPDAGSEMHTEVRLTIPELTGETRVVAPTLELALARALARLVVVLETQPLPSRKANPRGGA